VEGDDLESRGGKRRRMLVPVLLGLDLHQGRHVGGGMRVWALEPVNTFKSNVIPSPPRNKGIRRNGELEAFELQNARRV